MQTKRQGTKAPRTTEGQKDRRTEGQKDRRTEGQKDRRTERQKDRRTERQNDRRTERQKDRRTERRQHRDKVAVQYCERCGWVASSQESQDGQRKPKRHHRKPPPNGFRWWSLVSASVLGYCLPSMTLHYSYGTENGIVVGQTKFQIRTSSQSVSL